MKTKLVLIEAFEEYARPLILDEVTPVYVNGTPRHIRL